VTQPFVHFRVQSVFSFGRTASAVEDLVKQAAKLGQPALGIADEHNLHGAMALADKASGNKVQAIVGVKLYMPTASKDVTGSVLLFAQSEIGYINLCRLHNLAVAPGRTEGLLSSDLLGVIRQRNLGEGVIAITGCGSDSLIGRMITAAKPAEADLQAQQMLGFLKILFPERLYIEVCRNVPPSAEQAAIEKRVLNLALQAQLPIIATSEVLYATPDRHDALLVSKAVASSEKVKALDDGSIIDHSEERFHLRSEEEMSGLFGDLPEAIEQTAALAKRCGFAPGKRKEILPPFKTEGGRTEAEEIAFQAAEGLERRLRAHGISEDDAPRYRERLDYEVRIINQMGFPGYFLIVSDFIRWAKARDIPVGPGRGSGAGSVVAWSLEITDLDPIKFGLLFERFLNPERVSMPDFDVDFCPQRVEEVMAYVGERYGRECVARIATFTLTKSKSAIKDAARVVMHHEELGLTVHQSNELSSLIIEDPTKPTPLTEVYKNSPDFKERVDNDRRALAVFRNAVKIQGLYRTSSMHAAGVIIADRPLTEFVPVGFDAKTGSQVAQFNMKEVEKAGMVKFDFLALKNLTTINDAIGHIANTRGIKIDLATLPLDDAGVYAMLATGRTNGVFQFESDGMKDVLVKMRVSRFEDLIAAVSLFRPGPMEMIPSYCKRKLGQEEPVYPEPAERTKPFLEETFGIMVYQEQVMRVAQEVAGYSLGQADLLRRAMGKKIPEEMAKEKGRFVEGAVSNGTPQRKAEELFDLIEKFAGYGFNKSHAAAYALIAYQTAWLKHHYPVEYYSALLTHTPKVDKAKNDKRGLIKMEMDAVGVTFLPPDINRSFDCFVPEQDAEGKWCIRFGLTAISNVSEIGDFLAEREANGPYENIPAFFERAIAMFNSAQLTNLAHAGAFDCLQSVNNRRRICDSLLFLAKNARKSADKKTGDLFAGAATVSVPKDIEDVDDWSDRLDKEFEAVGFYFQKHPLDDLEPEMRVRKYRRRSAVLAALRAKGLAQYKDVLLYGTIERVGVFETRRKDTYVRFDLVEKNDRYSVSVFPSASGHESIESTLVAQQLLESAARNKTPFAVKADFVLRENGDAAIYGRALVSAPKLIDDNPLPAKYEIIIDPRLARLSPDVTDKLAQLDAEAIEAKRPEEDTFGESVLLTKSVTHDILDSLKDVISNCPENPNGEDRFEFVLQFRCGNYERHISVVDDEIPTDRVVNMAAIKAMTMTSGVLSVRKTEIPRH
jgi:DNA polymerase-3 subunit alpha